MPSKQAVAGSSPVSRSFNKAVLRGFGTLHRREQIGPGQRDLRRIQIEFLHLPVLVVIPDGDWLGEHHALDDMPQAIDEVKLIGAQNAIGLDCMTGELMNLQKELTNRRAAVGQRRMSKIEGATRQSSRRPSLPRKASGVVPVGIAVPCTVAGFVLCFIAGRCRTNESSSR